MAKDDKPVVYYWNNPEKALLYKGKSITEGDPIPESYEKEQPVKFENFKKSQNISKKPKVKFEDKKQKEYTGMQAELSKMRIRNNELLKSKGELEVKISEFEANLEDFEKLDAIKGDLKDIKEAFELIKLEKIEWDKTKSSKKELGELLKVAK